MSHMTGDEYRKILDKLGLNQTQAAQMFDVDARTIRRWLAEDVTIPLATATLLRLMIKHKMVRDYMIKQGEELARCEAPSK
jgi:DNA-binding transcriptional regulator YiaG